MTNTAASVVKPDVLKENMLTINSFLRQSYNDAKKSVQDGVTFFKEEFSSIYDRTGSYLNRMLLPVNNFLKDLAQIDTELEQEENREMAINKITNIIPIEHAAKGPMEENY